MRTRITILTIALVIMLAIPAFAEAPRTVHRASQVGGTGMMMMRTGDQLDPGEMNLSIFLEYEAFNQLPLNPTRIADPPSVDDPRGDAELWMTLTYNYGITHLFEVGIQVPLVFISDLRDTGVGRIGLDGRLLILNIDKFGLGISSTLWGNFPSFQLENSSNEFNGGGELNFSMRGEGGTNYIGLPWFDRWLLEEATGHVTMGWGYEDYHQFGRWQPPPPVLNDFTVRNPADADIVGQEVMYIGVGLEYQIYDNFWVGTELLTKQWPDKHNDNNWILILPELTYTFEDIVTTGLAFGFTELGSNDNHQPEWMVKGGVTYHFPELVNRRRPRPPTAPPVHEDLMDVFTPSRKPIPTEMEEEEILLDDGGEEIIPTDPVE